MSYRKCIDCHHKYQLGNALRLRLIEGRLYLLCWECYKTRLGDDYYVMLKELKLENMK